MPTLNVKTAANIDANIPEYWDKTIVHDADRKSFWSQLAGTEGSKNAVIEKKELISRPGDKITFNLVGRHLAKVNTGSAALAGNEVKLPTGSFAVTVGLRRTATSREYLVDVESIIDYLKESWVALRDWSQRDMDDQVFNEYLNQGEIKTLYANNRSSRDNLTSGDYLTVTELKKLWLAATRRGVEPVQKVGQGLLASPVYMVALSETDLYQLQADPDYEEDVRHAAIRGDSGAVFRGVVTSMYQGILLYAFRAVNNGDGMLGSYLRPEAELLATVTSTGTTITAGPSAVGSATTNVDYWQYFPDTGSTAYIRIGSEDMSYTPASGTMPGDTSLTVVRAANSTTGAAHTAGDLITLRHTGKVLCFGPQSMMRAWARMQNRSTQMEDYENELGVSIRYVNGVQQVLGTDSKGRSAVALECWSPSASTI